MNVLKFVSARFVSTFGFLALPFSVQAAVYNVGPAQPHSTIASVPWGALAPGDTVNIHWRSEPYREKIFVSVSGAENQIIQVTGIPGAEGQLPVINAENATTGSTMDAQADTEDAGILVVRRGSEPAPGLKPRYITISNLEFRGARPGRSFAAKNGATQPFLKTSAGIFVLGGEHITIRNCILSGCSLGLVVASGTSSVFNDELNVSRDILIERSLFENNGSGNPFSDANIQIEAIHPVLQFNRLDTLASEQNIVDSSAGAVIRCNWIQGAGTGVQLLPPVYSAGITSLDSRYGQDFIYGNVLVSGLSSQQLVLNGRQNLEFYQNTAIVASDRYSFDPFQSSSSASTTAVRNNIFFRTGLGSDFTLNDRTIVGTNWVSQGWNIVEASISGHLIVGTDPGFFDPAGHDFHIAAASACLDRGDNLDDAIPAEFRATEEYVAEHTSKARTLAGASPDLGAFEYFVPPGGWLQFDSNAHVVLENAGSLTMTVSRSGPTLGNVSVEFATIDGTARANIDYVPTVQTLTWANGENGPKTIAIPILDRPFFNGTRTLSVVLKSASGGAQAGGPGTITINDDDPAPIIGFSTNAFSVLEGGAIVIHIMRSGFVGGTSVSITISKKEIPERFFGMRARPKTP